MVQILPRFDPGGQIGKSVGSGVGQGMTQVADRKRMLSGLDALSGLDLENMSYGEIIRESAKGFAGIPGGMQVLQELLPGLLKQKQSLEYAKDYGEDGQGGAPGGSLDFDETSQLIDRTGSPQERVVEDISVSEQVPAQRPPQAGISETNRPELAPQMQKVPGLQEDIPAYRPMSRKERQDFARKMALGGASTDEIRKGVQDEEDRRFKNWESLTKAKQARTEQFREERGLENEQLDFIREKIAVESGVGAADLDPYEVQKGYELFKKYQEKSPKLTDQQLWNLARKDYNNMRESFATGQKLTRPGLFAGDVQRRLNTAREWAQDHLKKYGNFRQDREKLMSMLMQQGFTRTESQSIVRPMSSGLQNVVNKTEKAHQRDLPMRPDQMPRKPLRTPEEQSKYLSKLSDDIAENIKPTDSLLLLRDRLVRKKGLTEEDFETVLKDTQTKMKELGKTFNEEQSSEIPFMQERVKPSLYEIFFEGGFDMRKEFPRIAE